MSYSYIDSGFDEFLRRKTGVVDSRRFSNLDIEGGFESIGGQKIAASGKTLSRNGRISIDWELGTIIINDGATDRIIMGFEKGGF